MKKLLIIAILAAFVVSPAFADDDTCKSPCSSKSCAAKAKASEAKLNCPVCKMKIENKEKAVKLEHNGKTIYFMSEGCKEAFLKEPAKYLEACCKDEPCYSCSKGCDTVSKEAGKCPKCGAEMKAMDSTEKVACCQAKTGCEKKEKK